MNKKEQGFINQIKKESETVNIPKSLEPEEMEAALKSRPKKFVWKTAHTIAAAACCLLVCGIAYGMTKDAEHAGKRGAAGADAKELRNSGVETVDDYEEVYEYLQAYAMNASSYDEDGGEVMITEDSAADMAAGGAETKQQIVSETQKMDAAVPEAASAEYSETNVRQIGRASCRERVSNLV